MVGLEIGDCGKLPLSTLPEVLELESKLAVVEVELL